MMNLLIQAITNIIKKISDKPRKSSDAFTKYSDENKLTDIDTKKNQR